MGANVNYLAAKCYKRMWMLRNLKRFGASESDLIDVYSKQIQSVLEMACPVWHPGLTVQEENQLERIQKVAFAIIRSKGYIKYPDSLAHFKQDSLKDRRNKLCLNFALKTYKSEKFSQLFKPVTHSVNTRSVKMPLKTRTRRYRKSPLPYLTELMNNHIHAKQQNERQVEVYRKH